MASDHDRRRLLNFVILAVAMLAVGVASAVASITYANSTASRQDAQSRVQDKTIAQLRVQQLAACGFARDLGSVPLPDKPRPSRLGVSLVTDDRAQWRALHCPGTLPVPPGLAKWAAVYHLDGR
jgi:hypothetical protein